MCREFGGGTHPPNNTIDFQLDKTMNLFERIKPQKTFHITIKAVAKLLGIPPKMIVRIEKWDYVLFVHRRDIGGQFVSYRKLRNWQNAVAIKIKTCYKKHKLDMLWLTIENDRKKYAKQYQQAYQNFVKEVCNQQWDKLTEAFRSRSTATG